MRGKWIHIAHKYKSDAVCNDVSTPLERAWMSAHEVVEYSGYDGWSVDATYNTKYNKMQYMDFCDSNKR